jgi:hypothetical protein
MRQPRWLSAASVTSIHHEAIYEFGAGMRPSLDERISRQETR